MHPLTRYRLQRLISTREEDLVGMHKMGSIPALEKYAEGTSSQLLYLQVETHLVPANNNSGMKLILHVYPGVGLKSEPQQTFVLSMYFWPSCTTLC